MPFTPQSSELTNRIRRGFGQRGQLSVSVDEVAVPSVGLYNLDQVPFRTDGIQWFTTLAVPSNAANNSFAQVNADPSIIAVADELTVFNTNAGNQPINLNARLVAYAGNPNAVTTELANVPPAAFATAPLNMSGGNAAGLAGGCLSLLLLPGATYTIRQLDWFFQPGVVLEVFGGLINQSVNVSVRGRWWRISL